MKFQRESFAEAYKDAASLVEQHYQEIARYKDIPLNPDEKNYLAIEESGMLRVFTVRIDGAMIGYAVYFIKNNMHYQDSKQALQDVLFIQKDKRGQGREFIAWCDEQLKSEGVDVVYHHVKAKHNFGPMLERMGYELIDLIYGKRL